MRLSILLCVVVGLPACTGCVSWGSHGQINNAEHQHHVIMEDESHAVDHGEYPGDLDHRQQP